MGQSLLNAQRQVFTSKRRTELSDKMQGTKDLIAEQEYRGQDPKRLQFIFNCQTRDRNYNIISGASFTINDVTS